MDKIFRYIGIAIIALFLLIVSLSYFSSPPADKVEALRAFVQITKLYVDKRLIDPTKVEPKNEDFKFIRYWAEYLRKITDSEREVNTKRKIAKIAVTSGNLATPEAVSRGYNKLNEFVAVSNQSFNDSYLALNEMVENLSKLNTEKTIFQPDALVKAAAEEAQYFDLLNSYQQAAAKYLQGMLDFVSSRDGYYSINGGAIIFQSAQDQAYFDSLYNEMRKYDNSIDLEANKHREELRSSLNKLFSE